MYNIILCGGNGSRLWPLSRTQYPKQFNKILSNEISLFQSTVIRNSSICEKHIIISNENQFFLALDQLNEINVDNFSFILEPVGRNTAPAITLACMQLNYDDLVLVAPSDHYIQNNREYEEVVKKSKELALKNNIVIFGIKPEYAETGYGYIQFEGMNVLSFKEKPDYKTAYEYLSLGNYYWNSGMFVFKAGVFLDELKKLSPSIYDSCELAIQKADLLPMIRIKQEDMMAIPSGSIDVEVLEKSSNIKMVAADIGWSDLGSFESLYRQFPKDKNNNVSSKNNYCIDSSNNLIISGTRTIATIDIEDLIIVDTDDALLVSKKGSSQKVKDIFNLLEKNNSDLCHTHRTTYRPWGHYTVLEKSDKYKIKKVTVKPQCKLRRQKHFHRNEHWVILQGSAKVTIGDKERILRNNESTFIPMGEEHVLENPGKIDLVLIEIQVGEYLSEDDIVSIQ